jgi:hypothetical protein
LTILAAFQQRSIRFSDMYANVIDAQSSNTYRCISAEA